MVVNFRARGISWGARKLTWTLTLKKKKKTSQAHKPNLQARAHLAFFFISLVTLPPPSLGDKALFKQSFFCFLFLNFDYN